LVRPTAGAVILEGRSLTALRGASLREARSAFQMVFQDPYASLNPRMTVFDTLAEAMQAHAKVPRRELPGRIDALLEKVGLSQQARRKYPHEFRAASASASPSPAPWPVAPNCWWPMSRSRPWTFRSRRKSSTCWPGFPARWIDPAVHFPRSFRCQTYCRPDCRHVPGPDCGDRSGGGCDREPAASLHQGPDQRHSDPRPAARDAARPHPFAGRPPSPLHPPSGCPFHPRCLHAIDRCAQVVPALEPFGQSGRQASCIRMMEINPP